MKTVRIMLVDDSPAFLTAARDFLSAEPNVEVVAECRDGGEAIVQARASRPDLVLMDFMMPGMNGLEAIRLLKTCLPTLRIVLCTLDDYPELRASALDAGAEAIIGKADLATHLPPLLAGFTPRAA